MKALPLFLACAFFASSLWAAENWPEFRGPTGNGHSDAKGLPIAFGDSDHVKWKTAIHGKAWSCPVIWGDQLWVTTANEEGTELGVVELGRAAGHVGHRGKHLLGEAAQHAERRNPVPHFEFGVLRRPIDNAGSLHAGDERRRQLELVLALAQQQVRKADTRGADTDDQDVVVWGDVLNVGIDKTVRT